MNRQREGWRRQLLEVLLIGIALVLMLVFLDPVSHWVGDFMADRIEP